MAHDRLIESDNQIAGTIAYMSPEILHGAPASAASDLYALGAIAFELLRRHTQPIVLLLEDLQWTAEGMEPLQLVSRIAGEVPLLIMGSYRYDEAPELSKHWMRCNTSTWSV